MHAIRFHQYGAPEVLKYEEVSDPKPRKDQVSVRVKACAMNHLDIWVRKGITRSPLPHIPGKDVTGEVMEVGEVVTRIRLCHRVLHASITYTIHTRIRRSTV